MSDERLRALHRAWVDGGSVEDGAAFLAAATRAGLVPRERLRLGAYVGWAPALQGLVELDEPPDWDASTVLSLREWAEGLAQFPHEARVRVTLAACRSGLVRWEQTLGPSTRAREAIDAVEAWLARPTAERADAVHYATGYRSSNPEFLGGLCAHVRDPDGVEALARSVELAASYPGWAVVREAIEAEVREWLLAELPL